MITTKELAKLEDEAESRGLKKIILMEKAGEGIANILQKRFKKDQKILFICYHGNNGGDGFAAARILKEHNYNVKVFFIGQEDKLARQAACTYDLLKSFDNIFDPEPNFFEYEILIDCILGTGIDGEIKDPIASIIKEMNNSPAEKIAVDIPTGINPDTGELNNVFFEADLIITMHDLKPGLDPEITEIVDIGL